MLKVILTDHESVAESKDSCIACEICSFSRRISWRDFVPRILRRVVAARSWVDFGASSTFVTDIIGSNILK